MTDSRAAYDPNRLPWLSDTPQPPRRSGWAPVLLWGMLALLLVAAVGYWAGLRSGPGEAPAARAPEIQTRAQPQPKPVAAPPANTLPTAPALEPTPEAEPLPPPLVQAPALQREQAPPRVVSQSEPVAAEAATETQQDDTAAASQNSVMTEAAPAAAPPSSVPVKAAPPRPAPSTRSATQLWPADQSENAYGRVVRIGTFSSRLQAKRAWWRIIKVYPGMRRLKATVVANPSLRNGRTYYRLQFGTTSQAHSTVLCQRMRIVGQSCVVIGVGGA